MFTNHVYLIYMYKQDLALNNLPGLICHKRKTNQPTNQPYILHIPWIHALKPVPVGVVSDVLIFWVIGEFRVFQHHTPLNRIIPSEMINFWVTNRIERSTNFILQLISSSERDVNICMCKSWTAIDKFSTMWKSDFSNRIKQKCFQTAAMSVLLYGYSIWNLTKC